MNRQDFLRLVSKEIHFIFDRKSIARELNEHLNDSVEDLVAEGLSREEAEEQAVLQMGEPEEIGKLLDKEHQPILGYVWMTTKGILIAMVIISTIILLDVIQSGLDLMFPYQNTGYRIEESHAIDMEIETANFNVILDNVCSNEHGEYMLTYRAKTKLESIRIRPMFVELAIGYSEIEHEGVSNNIRTRGSLGEKGFMMFEWPEDDILYLHGGKSGVMQLDLGEYMR